MTPALMIDARGLSCPLPLLKLKQALHGSSAGQPVHLLASDKNSLTDIKRFCQIAGHPFEVLKQDEGQFEFLIMKASS